jgi:hypothetical protein
MLANNEVVMGEPGWMWRFYSQIGDEDAQGCWPWAGHGLAAGYGTISVNGRTWLATHLALTISGEDRPKGHYALHRCDNPRCVNPDHLWWGTQRDNMLDMSAKGRGKPLQGVNNPLAKLTDNDVRLIRQSHEPASVLASRFRVDRSKICRIRNRKAWAHVQG